MFSLLYVDDEPGLLEIGKLFLESAGDFSVTTALSGKEGLDQLGQHSFDAVISDYQMPEMNGIEFLKHVRKSFSTIPFILFTGRGREEVVIGAINNGVDFYLQKGGEPHAQFAELAHKVRQAVQRRQAETALSDSERRLADIINFLPDATFATDREGVVIAWNRAIERMTGVSAKDVLGRGNYEYSLPFYHERRPLLVDLVLHDDPAIATKYPFVKQEGRTFVSEITIPHFNSGRGAALWFTASPLYNRMGEVVGAIESIREITERKRAEEELQAANEQLAASGEELRAQYDELAQSETRIRMSEIRLTYMLGFYEYVQKGESELLGYAIEGAGIVTGSSLGYLAFLNEDESELSMYAWSKSAMAECSMREKPLVYKTEKTGLWGEAVRQRRPVITNDYAAPNPAKKGYPEGHPQIIRHMNVPVIDDGRIVLVAGVANKPSGYTEDDTNGLLLLMQGLWAIIKRKQVQEEQKAAYEQLAATDQELQQQYDQLRKSEEELRMLKISVDQSADEVFWLDFEGNILYVNDAACRINGYSRDEFLAFRIYDLNPDLTREIWMRSVSDLRAKKTQLFTTRHRHRDGTIIDVEIMAVYVNQDGKEYSFAFVRDITDRKRSQTALVESEERYRTLVESSFDGIAIHQDRILVYVNRTAARLLGSEDPAVFIGKPAIDLVAPEFRAQIAKRVQRASESSQELIREQFLRLDGTAIDVDVTTTPCTWQGKEAAYVTFRDISAQMRAGEALRESEEKYRMLVEHSRDGVFIVEDGRLVFYNRALAGLTGYSTEELTNRPLADLIVPEDRELVVSRAKDRAMGKEVPEQYEFSLLHKDGTGRTRIRVRAGLGTYKGRPVSIGTFYDITENLKREEALRESETKYRELTELLPQIVFEMDTNFRITFVNRQAYTALGYTPDDVAAGFSALSIIDPSQHDRIRENIVKLAGKERVEHTEYTFIRKDGSTFPALIYADPIVKGGQLTGFRGIIIDISDRKKADDALRESGEWAKTILNTAQAGIILVDAETHRILEANRKALDLIGLPRDSVIGAVCHRFICTAEAGKCPVTDCGLVVDTSARVLLTASGTHIPVLKTVVPTTLGGKNVLVESFVDISEQKQSEAAIREANRKLNLLNSITRHDIRNQLMVAQGYTQLAALNKPDPVVADFLGRITSAIETIQRQIEFTKAYQELGVHAPAWFPIGEVIICSRPENIALRNTCRAVEIFADPMIDKVFFNLFENAVKYGERVTSVTITCEQKDRGLVISVADDGVGIRPGEKKKIFDKGYGKNTGFGLFLAREILAITGITISESGTFGRGAVFEIAVPEGAFRKSG